MTWGWAQFEDYYDPNIATENSFNFSRHFSDQDYNKWLETGLSGKKPEGHKRH